MEVIILSSLLLAGIVLLLVELFLLPGTSIAGIGSALSFGGGIYYAFAVYGVPVGVAVIIISVVVAAFAIYKFMKSKTLDTISLHTTIEGKNNPLEGISVSVGDTGVAVSRLAPMGKVRINGNTIEVKVVSDMIDTGEQVRITEISTSGIVVERNT